MKERHFDFINEFITQMLALLTFFIFPIIQYFWLKYLAKNEALPSYGFCRSTVSDW
jgi:hypothetical protein